jgi:hypothetical protein
MAKLNQHKEDERNMLVSFLTIRKAVGILGIALPVVLVAGTKLIDCCPIIKYSVSGYYYSVMGNYLTGTLCAVGLFLFTYKGNHHWEQPLTNISAVFAVLTALFPTNSSHLYGDCNIICKPDSAISNTVHYLAAALFFVILAGISIWIFPMLDPGKSFTKQKRQRNKIYKTCGWIMIGSLIFIPALQIDAVNNAVGRYKPEFWLESITLWAFGFSWLVKGGTILKDK